MPENHVKYRKVGDLGNPLTAQLKTEKTQTVIDLTTAVSVYFVMSQVNDDSTVTELINKAASVDDATTGQIRYQWVAGDTSVAGTHLGKFVVNWPNSEPETFPAQGYIEIRIEDLP
jgi:hypothetical protein